MNRIVDRALKVDFHIHSKASNHKDNEKVKNGTLENINVLVSKLQENEVNMIAITDHDNFDYDIYSKLKEEEAKENCIQKVLPGIEFSVCICEEVLHVIALFNDENVEISKLQKIQSNLFDKEKNKPLYDRPDLNAFSEEKFISILRNIKLDTVLIAHQKASLGSKSKRKHDINTIDPEKMEELIFIDYFEAFEFNDKRNEIFNKVYIEHQKQRLSSMRFITGSDCHNWEKYPENDSNFEFSYFKCLPTFRGVMLAVTDSSRVKIGIDSFFSVKAPLKSIDLKINGQLESINLSKGINVIIGDNSIGKSLLLHKMTDYRELSKNSKLQKAYDNYLNENNIEVLTKIPSDFIRQFDSQGSIREMFMSNKTRLKDFINKCYPNEPDYSLEKEKVQRKIEEFVGYLDKKEKIEKEKKNLTNIKLELYDDFSTSLQVIEITTDYKAKKQYYIDLISEIKILIEKNQKLSKNSLLETSEKKIIEEYTKFLGKLQIKYQEKKDRIELETAKINIINNQIKIFMNELETTKSEMQKSRENYNLKFEVLANTISNLYMMDESKNLFNIGFDKIKLSPTTNEIGKNRFVCKCNIKEINSDYIKEILTTPLNATYKKHIKDFNSINPVEFKENIKYADKDDEEEPLKYYKSKVYNKLDSDLKIIYSINDVKDSDALAELSSGANSQIYFDLLANDVQNKGMYIVDQPEDDVSQTAIKNKILEDFRKISSHRQVLLITHNPQFIVNLDVDNVIFIKKSEKTGQISIEYGALEYKDTSTDILKIVADNIDGGINSLKERYKKYEKNN
ncbi:MAG: hypothetical protein ACI4XK_04880 [Bacilli bacterium]